MELCQIMIKVSLRGAESKGEKYIQSQSKAEHEARLCLISFLCVEDKNPTLKSF